MKEMGMICVVGILLLALLMVVVVVYKGDNVHEHMVLPRKRGDIFIHDNLYIDASPKGGYGVYTSEFIPNGTEVEVAKILKLEPYDRDNWGVELAKYDYNYDVNSTFIVFGFGSLYNHNTDYNVDYSLGDDELMHYKARCDIQPGEELFVNYGDEYFTMNKINQI